MKKYESYILLPMNTWNQVDILWLIYFIHTLLSVQAEMSVAGTTTCSGQSYVSTRVVSFCLFVQEYFQTFYP